MTDDYVIWVMAAIILSAQAWVLGLIYLLGKTIRVSRLFWLVAVAPVFCIAMVVAEGIFDLLPYSITNSTAYMIFVLSSVFFASPLALTLVVARLRKAREEPGGVHLVFK